MKIPLWVVIRSTLIFMVSGVLYLNICRWIGHGGYALEDLGALSFGYFWGALALRNHANSTTGRLRTKGGTER